MTATTTYPVHVEAQLEAQLSRWRWLFKWLLALPHYVVLAFLWVAFVALSFVAFVAILFTGRYPRAVFDFNVGVLRWTWRVTYYAYGALATDRYPPFLLAERADYPAHLDIDYPEHLSRGLVLVKWWLLAIPHYLVISLFLGGAGFAFADANGGGKAAGIGLIGLLVLVAGIILLFTGRYPQPLYDFVLGLNRWVLRVAAYAALMTDVYPPFRLDQGGDDPATAAPVVGTGAPTFRAAPQRSGTARVVALVVGSIMLLGSLALGLGGTVLGVADHGLRDDHGFLMSGTTHLATNTYALSSTSMTIRGHGPSALMPHRMLGDVRITALSDTAPVFVGIARSDDVAAYLAGVGQATVKNLAGGPRYDVRQGAAPSTLPTQSDIWVTQSAGSGQQEVTWPVQNGDWTVVVMNEDGSRGVRAAVRAGATVPALDWLVPTVLAVAGMGLVVAIVLLAVGLRSPSDETVRPSRPRE